MFVIYVQQLAALRKAVLPLIHVANRADMKCSAHMMSLIVSQDSRRFVAALRMAAPFFTTFSSGVDERFLSRIFLDFFSRNLYSFRDDDVSLTFFLQEGRTLAPLKFENPRTGYLQYSALILLPPRNVDLSEIEVDCGMFVAVASLAFRHITRELSIYDTVRITLTDTQVKFSVETEEIILTTEERQCIIGGMEAGGETQLLITLNPKNFFIHASFLSNFVWLFKSTDSCTLLSFPIELYANILIHFPR